MFSAIYLLCDGERGFCFNSFLENHYGGECDCSGKPLPHVLNSCSVSEKCAYALKHA